MLTGALLRLSMGFPIESTIPGVLRRKFSTLHASPAAHDENGLSISGKGEACAHAWD